MGPKADAMALGFMLIGLAGDRRVHFFGLEAMAMKSFRCFKRSQVATWRGVVLERRGIAARFRLGSPIHEIHSSWRTRRASGGTPGTRGPCRPACFIRTYTQAIGLEFLVLQVGEGDDHEVELLQRPLRQLHHAGISQALHGMLEVDVGDLVADGELEGIILVLADEVEEPPAGVDITAGM